MTSNWLEDARRDAALAVRLLVRQPIVAVTAVLSLAIGIGANSAIFTVANALLYRAPAGVAEPERLVDVGIGRPDSGFNPASYPTYLDIRQRSTTLDGVYAHPMFPGTMSLVAAGTPASSPASASASASASGLERVHGQFVTTNYFSVTRRETGGRPAVRPRRQRAAESATLARVLPGGFEGIGIGATVPGVTREQMFDFEPDWNVVDAGYFTTLRIPIVAGRDFTDNDREGTQPVVIVDEAAAKFFWPGKDPIGQQILQHIGGEKGLPDHQVKLPLTVIGVARHVKSTSMIDGMSQAFIYLPLQQQHQHAAQMTGQMMIVARADTRPASRRSAAEGGRRERSEIC